MLVTVLAFTVNQMLYWGAIVKKQFNFTFLLYLSTNQKPNYEIFFWFWATSIYSASEVSDFMI